MKFINTIDKHINEPDVSVNEYIRSQCIELSQSVITQKIVYLDTKFWIIIRDVSLGRNSNPGAVAFHDLVLSLADSEKCIFPMSQDIFIEVLKQSVAIGLDETVRLIDLLSKGVSLISLDERVFLEALQFMLSLMGHSVYECNEQVWTKLTYTMGFITPTNIHPDELIDRALQKAYIDQMWSCSLSDMVEQMKENGEISLPAHTPIANTLNAGQFAHEHENSTFGAMFTSELAGMLDVYQDIFPDLSARLIAIKAGKEVDIEKLNTPESHRLLRNAIYNTFKLGKAKNNLPTFGILSGLYAATRWDKQQRFEENDIHDFNHAASALPYADYFFTEKGLAHLITQKSTQYDKLYQCNVQSKVKGAFNALALVG